MKQAALKLKSYKNSVNIVDNGNLQKKMLNIMLGTIGLMALCYFALLSSMVFNIVERKSLQTYASTLGNEVGDLELEYLSKSEKIDLSYAHSLGFKETKATFATRSSLGSLDTVSNEI